MRYRVGGDAEPVNGADVLAGELPHCGLYHVALHTDPNSPESLDPGKPNLIWGGGDITLKQLNIVLDDFNGVTADRARAVYLREGPVRVTWNNIPNGSSGGVALEIIPVRSGA